MVIITLCLMLLLSSSNGRLGNPEAPRASLHRDALPPLAVTVFAPSDMSESLVNRICAGRVRAARGERRSKQVELALASPKRDATSGIPIAR